MIILHYMTETDGEIAMEVFETNEEAQTFMLEHEIVEEYSLIEGRVLELG